MEKVIWKDAVGFEGKYKVSSHGDILKCKNGEWSPQTLTIHPKGYIYFGANISKGKNKTVRVHELVCEAFVAPKPSKRHTADHIDGNEGNNHYSNLQWLTMSEQTKKAIANGAKRGGPKRRIAQKTRDGKLIAIHESGAAAARAVGKDYSGTVFMACNKVVPTYLGYVWEYAEEESA
jgi:hypothetical protein